ncbi:MAG: MOSC domain-containing protein [Flavobacteriales bacterium]|nr:MOSC domain-containing protein [Flavobacteriales bacterium]
MSVLTLASIHLYPIKSLGGFSVNEARLTDRGLEHDRRWMLVDDAGLFLSQRELATMACLHTSALRDGFRVMDVRDGATLDLPWRISEGGDIGARVWDDPVPALIGDPSWSTWFRERLGRRVRLVFMPDATKRPTDARYAEGLTSLSDGFPYLILSQASLDDLNARLEERVPIERFRPNLVINGGAAFQEDTWKEIAIGAVKFHLVKPCARCMIITTDQRTGERGKEPLRTLATYRRDGEKVLFGMNAMGDAPAMVHKGDEVTMLS